MDTWGFARSITLMGVTFLAAYFLFRRNPQQALLARGAFFIEVLLIFFYFGFVDLPQAMPGVFERVLGHSVDAIYMTPVQPDGTQTGGTWWLVRWVDPVRTAYFYILLGGIVWAGLNVVQKRARKLNIVALLFGLLSWATHLALTVLCFPLCF
jgi:hypothetical protein